MREILFRAKAINREPDGEYRTNYQNGDWVYGLLTRKYNERYDLPSEFTNENGESGIEVDYKTLGQYTGLTDKNGVKIFEGDIVKVKNALVRGIFAVEFGMSASFIVSRGESRYFLGGCNSEVIGNIYDNPELIGGISNENN